MGQLQRIEQVGDQQVERTCECVRNSYVRLPRVRVRTFDPLDRVHADARELHQILAAQVALLANLFQLVHMLHTSFQ